jgi:hypothetical protein
MELAHQPAELTSRLEIAIEFIGELNSRAVPHKGHEGIVCLIGNFTKCNFI